VITLPGVSADPDVSPLSGTVERASAKRQALSVGLATGLYGISFGALATTSGLSIIQAQILSLVLFSGGSQFAVVGVLGAGGSAASAIATSSLLGARNTFYALRMAQILDVRGWRRLGAAHLTIDESTAVGTAQGSVMAQRLGFWLTGVTIFAGWNLMTLAGSVAGNSLGDPKRWGLDAAASAAFLALLWPRLTARPAQVLAAAAVVIALSTSPFLTSGVPVILTIIAAFAVAAWVTRRRVAPRERRAR